jgi:hypothetical protein
LFLYSWRLSFSTIFFVKYMFMWPCICLLFRIFCYSCFFIPGGWVFLLYFLSNTCSCDYVYVCCSKSFRISLLSVWVMLMKTINLIFWFRLHILFSLIFNFHNTGDQKFTQILECFIIVQDQLVICLSNVNGRVMLKKTINLIFWFLLHILFSLIFNFHNTGD